MMVWLSQQPSWIKAREIAISTQAYGLNTRAIVVPGEEDESGEKPGRRVAYLPSFDTTYSIWYKRHYIRITRTKAQKGGNGTSEHLTLKCVCLPVYNWPTLKKHPQNPNTRPSSFERPTTRSQEHLEPSTGSFCVNLRFRCQQLLATYCFTAEKTIEIDSSRRRDEGTATFRRSRFFEQQDLVFRPRHTLPKRVPSGAPLCFEL